MNLHNITPKREGRPAKPIRLWFGFTFLLKQLESLVIEKCSYCLKNPYFQYFLDLVSKLKHCHVMSIDTDLDEF